MKDYIKSLSAILFSFFLFSCETKAPTCALTIDQLLNKDGNKVIEVSQGNSNRDFRDKGKDTIEGGYYSFYKNGKIKEYNFLVSSNKSIYKEQYDSLGYLMYQEGVPLVHKSAELINDSLIIKLYFLTLNKKYKLIRIMTGNDNNIPVTLSEDSLFSNIQVARNVVRKLFKEQDIEQYIIVEYQNECTGKIETFTDSISLHYKPEKN